MLFQIFIQAPSVVMAEIVWLIRVGIALTCLISLLVLAVVAVVVVYKIRLDNRSVPYRQRPGLLLPATFFSFGHHRTACRDR